jgi:hypothetical protein
MQYLLGVAGEGTGIKIRADDTVDRFRGHEVSGSSSTILDLGNIPEWRYGPDLRPL